MKYKVGDTFTPLNEIQRVKNFFTYGEKYEILSVLEDVYEYTMSDNCGDEAGHYVDDEWLDENFKLVSNDKTWEDRLLIETQNRAEELNKLNTFLASPKFLELDRENKDLLYWQSRTMTTLVQVLGKRLEYNGIEFKHKNND